MRIYYAVFLSLLLCLSGWLPPVHAQTEKRQRFIDSLVKQFPKEISDSAKGLMAMNIAQYKMGVAQNTGNWDDAIEWARKGVYYSGKGNFRLGVRRCNWQLGSCFKQKGNYPEAIRYYTAMKNTAIQENVPGPVVISYTWIGDCYMLLGNYPEALKNYQSGLALCSERAREIYDRKTTESALILKTGDVYARMKNFPAAITSYTKLLDSNKPDSTGVIHAKIALAEIGLKKYKEAEQHLQTAIQRLPRLLSMKPETEYRGVMGSFLLQIGEAYCTLGSVQEGTESIQSYTKAAVQLKKSLSLLQEGAGGKEALITAYQLLKEACTKTGDFEEALTYTNLYTGLRDSVYNKENYLKLAGLQVQFETEKAAAALKLEQEKEKLRTAALLAEERLVQENKLSEQRMISEKALDAERLEKEKEVAITREKAGFEKKIALEKLNNEKQQVKNLLLMGLALVVITSAFLIIYLRQIHAKKRAVEKAETVHQLAELELQSLRSQLNPHFMFNSLNSIQTLIMKEQTEQSQSYLSRFARLLRMLLENADKPFIPLRAEMEFLQLYLSLESLRIPDMQYSIYTDDKINTEEVMIPNMILQPYVENAIWHGLSYKDSNKLLQIRVFRENGTIHYEIEDNGVGRKKSGELKSLYRKQHQSKGMELIHKRIQLLNKEYSAVIRTEISDIVQDDTVNGTLVSIRVPAGFSEQFQ